MCRGGVQDLKILLLCRYAGGLRPRFSAAECTDGHYTVVVYLPNNSPVKLAAGLPMRTRRLAVSSACLRAIKMLHQVLPKSWLYTCVHSVGLTVWQGQR